MAANGVFNTTEMQKKHRSKFETPRARSQATLCRAWLKELIVEAASNGESVSKASTIEKGKESGYTEPQVLDAKRALGVSAVRRADDQKQWEWILPKEKMEPVAVVAQEKIVTQATQQPCEDEFTLTPAERKKYGISDHEQVCWIRDPVYWKGKVPGDPVRQFERSNVGGRVIVHEGKFVDNGVDVILAVRDFRAVEKLRGEEQKRADEIAHQNATAHDDDFDRLRDDQLRQRKEQNTIEHLQAGLIGPQSPSSGMAYEDYVRNRGLTAADIEREERMYSLGTANREISDEEAESVMAANRGRGRSRGTEGDGSNGSKFYSLPPNIRPRNLAKA